MLNYIRKEVAVWKELIKLVKKRLEYRTYLQKDVQEKLWRRDIDFKSLKTK